MRYKIFVLIFILIGLVSNIFPQTHFRSGLFLHHSTGGIIWGSSNPNVPQLINMYNTEKNYTGNNAVTMNIDPNFFPLSRQFSDHNWDCWHAVFIGESAYPEDDDSLLSYIANNPIIVIKTGWGGTSIAPMGNPADTLIIDDEDVGSGGRTYYRTQWHWRNIVRVMQSYPDNFFVIWTGIPLMPGPGYDGTIAHNFVLWAKDTLASGLDVTYGTFPPNVYVFDAFHLLATPTEEFSWGTAYWGMNPLYHDAGDNHPNVTGANVVAQPFIWETFDAAIAYEGIVPVELESFSASINVNSVELKWQTVSELNNLGFEIQRSSENTEWEKIGFVEGNGTSTIVNNYSFSDAIKNVNGKYHYRLKQIDNDGTFEYSATIEVSFLQPLTFSLEQNYPNPFNPTTTIRFNLPKAENVKLTLYNLLGQKIITLVNEYKEPGVYVIIFEASDLNSGMYIYEIEAGSFTQTRKMTLIK